MPNRAFDCPHHFPVIKGLCAEEPSRPANCCTACAIHHLLLFVPFQALLAPPCRFASSQGSFLCGLAHSQRGVSPVRGAGQGMRRRSPPPSARSRLDAAGGVPLTCFGCSRARLGRRQPAGALLGLQGLMSSDFLTSQRLSPGVWQIGVEL